MHLGHICSSNRIGWARRTGQAVVIFGAVVFGVATAEAGLMWNVVETSTSITYKFEELTDPGGSKYGGTVVPPGFGQLGIVVAKTSLGAPANNGTFPVPGQGLAFSFGSDAYGLLGATPSGPFLQPFWATPLTESGAFAVFSQYPTLDSGGGGPYNDFVNGTFTLPVSGTTVDSGGPQPGDDPFGYVHMWTQRVDTAFANGYNYKGTFDIGWDPNTQSYFGTAAFELVNNPPAGVPEPGTLVFLGGGGLVYALRRRWGRKARKDVAATT